MLPQLSGSLRFQALGANILIWLDALAFTLLSVFCGAKWIILTDTCIRLSLIKASFVLIEAALFNSGSTSTWKVVYSLSNLHNGLENNHVPG